MMAGINHKISHDHKTKSSNTHSIKINIGDESSIFPCTARNMSMKTINFNSYLTSFVKSTSFMSKRNCETVYDEVNDSNIFKTFGNRNETSFITKENDLHIKFNKLLQDNLNNCFKDNEIKVKKIEAEVDKQLTNPLQTKEGCVKNYSQLFTLDKIQNRKHSCIFHF